MYDATKIYTTSHDGTVRCGDLNRLVFDEVSWCIRGLVLNYEKVKCIVKVCTDFTILT